MDNYERLVNAISKSSGLSVNEIEEKVHVKQEKISGLISKEGAAQIVAAELGISLDDEKLKLNSLTPGMRRVNTLGKVLNLFPVRTFVRNGQESKVANLVIADDTSNIKVVLWDTNHIDLIERNKIMEGSVIEITNANLRENEIHLGSFSELKLSNEIMDNVKTEKVYNKKKILDLRSSDNVAIRAFIVQVFDPKFFNICPECKKKVMIDNENFTCVVHGKVIPEKRALINIVLDDGTETIRAVLFHEKIASIGLTELEDPESLGNQKQDLLGKEMIFSGNVRMNSFFNNLEMIVDEVEDINPDSLIVVLENK